MARSWGDGSPTQGLHHTAFDMYETLAAELGCETYRKLPVLSVSPGYDGIKAAKKRKDLAAIMNSKTLEVILDSLKQTINFGLTPTLFRCEVSGLTSLTKVCAEVDQGSLKSSHDQFHPSKAQAQIQPEYCFFAD